MRTTPLKRVLLIGSLIAVSAALIGCGSSPVEAPKPVDAGVGDGGGSGTPPPPNLTLTNEQLVFRIKPDGGAHISFIVRNTGNGPLRQNCDVTISKVIDNNAVVLRTVTVRAPLAPKFGQLFDEVFTKAQLEITPSGTPVKFMIKADPNNAIDERDPAVPAEERDEAENDNSQEAERLYGADIVVGNFGPVESADGGTVTDPLAPLKISLTLNNPGNLHTGQFPIAYQYAVVQPPAALPPDAPKDAIAPIPPLEWKDLDPAKNRKIELKARTSFTETLEFKTIDFAGKTLVFRALADAGSTPDDRGAVLERNEANNSGDFQKEIPNPLKPDIIALQAARWNPDRTVTFLTWLGNIGKGEVDKQFDVQFSRNEKPWASDGVPLEQLNTANLEALPEGNHKRGPIKSGYLEPIEEIFKHPFIFRPTEADAGQVVGIAFEADSTRDVEEETDQAKKDDDGKSLNGANNYRLWNVKVPPAPPFADLVARLDTVLRDADRRLVMRGVITNAGTDRAEPYTYQFMVDGQVVGSVRQARSLPSKTQLEVRAQFVITDKQRKAGSAKVELVITPGGPDKNADNNTDTEEVRLLRQPRLVVQDVTIDAVKEKKDGKLLFDLLVVRARVANTGTRASSPFVIEADTEPSIGARRESASGLQTDTLKEVTFEFPLTEEHFNGKPISAKVTLKGPGNHIDPVEGTATSADTITLPAIYNQPVATLAIGEQGIRCDEKWDGNKVKLYVTVNCSGATSLGCQVRWFVDGVAQEPPERFLTGPIATGASKQAEFELDLGNLSSAPVTFQLDPHGPHNSSVYKLISRPSAIDTAE